MGAEQEHDRVLVDDLDAYVAGDDEIPPDEPPPVPDNADEANRILRRVGRLEREAEAIEKLADAETRRIDAWREDRLRGVERSIEFQVQSLESWMRALNAEDPRRKTIKVPNGELRLRPKRVSILVLDAAAAIEACPEWDSTTPQFNRQAALPLLREGPAFEDGEFSGPTPEPGFHYCRAVTAESEVVPGIVLVVPDESAKTAKTFGYTAKETR